MKKDPAKTDPYYEWLGIPPGQRPPTHYQMLGLVETESNVNVIATAAMRNSAFVRNFQNGAMEAEATRILTEIAQARTVLSDPAQRRAYDAQMGIGKPKPAPAAEPNVAPVKKASTSKGPTSSRLAVEEAKEEVRVVERIVNERRPTRPGPSRSGTARSKKQDMTVYWIVGGAISCVALTCTFVAIRSMTKRDNDQFARVSNRENVKPENTQPPQQNTPVPPPNELHPNPYLQGNQAPNLPNGGGPAGPGGPSGIPPWGTPPGFNDRGGSGAPGTGGFPFPRNGSGNGNGIGRQGGSSNQGGSTKYDTTPRKNNLDGFYDTVNSNSWNHKATKFRFRETGPENSYLIGVRLWEGKSFGGNVAAIQPIYQLADQRKFGRVYGRKVGNPTDEIAKDGYAVGGFDFRTGMLVDGVTVIYRKIVGDKLDPKDTYRSRRYGKDTGGWQLELKSGRFIRGILGDADNELISLGFVMDRDTKPE